MAQVVHQEHQVQMAQVVRQEQAVLQVHQEHQR
jgi:hypothetical protein